MSRIVYVVNGPNLNLLGKRQPAIYGHETLADVEATCQRVAAECRLELEFRQSNAESQVIDWVRLARRSGGDRRPRHGRLPPGPPPRCPADRQGRAAGRGVALVPA